MSRGPADLWGGFEANRRFNASRRSACRVSRNFLFCAGAGAPGAGFAPGAFDFSSVSLSALISAPIRVAGHLRPATSHRSLSFNAAIQTLTDDLIRSRL